MYFITETFYFYLFCGLFIGGFHVTILLYYHHDFRIFPILAHPSRSAHPAPQLLPAGPQNAWPNLWEIVSWEVALGKMSFEKYLTLSHVHR